MSREGGGLAADQADAVRRFTGSGRQTRTSAALWQQLRAAGAVTSANNDTYAQALAATWIVTGTTGVPSHPPLALAWPCRRRRA